MAWVGATAFPSRHGMLTPMGSMFMTFLHFRNDSLSSGCWSRPNAGVNARLVGLRRHLRVLPSRTRPSLFAGD
jgi:hypothetical protein